MMRCPKCVQVVWMIASGIRFRCPCCGHEESRWGYVGDDDE